MKKKTKVAKKVKPNKNKNVKDAAFRFLRHFTEESPKIFWRIATFSSSSKDIREEIILPLAEMLTNLKKAGLSLEEKEFNNFKFILFWPELALKLPGSLRKAAFNLGLVAASKGPRFYKRSQLENLDKAEIIKSIKSELGLDKLQQALALHSKPKVHKRKRRLSQEG